MTFKIQNQKGPVIAKRNWKFGRGMTARHWWYSGDAGGRRHWSRLISC